MGIRHMLRRLRGSAKQPARHCRPRLEALEIRLVPSCDVPSIVNRVLTLNCDNSASTIILDTGASGNLPATFITSNFGTLAFNDANFSMTQVNTGRIANTVDVLSISRPTAITGGGGLDNVYVGNGNSVQGIVATLMVSNPPAGGYTALTINNLGTASHQATVTLSESGIVGLAPAAINYQQGDLRSLNILYGGGINTTFTVNNTPTSGFPGGLSTMLISYSSGTLNVEKTTGWFGVTLGIGGSINVNISPSARNLNDIQGDIAIGNGRGTIATMVVNDQNNADAQTYSMTASTVQRSGSAAIEFGSRLVDFVTLYGGSGSNVYNVNSTSPLNNQTTVYTGTGNNTVNVAGTGRGEPLFITEQGSGNDTVNIGSTANTLDPISHVTINDASGTGTVNVNDAGFAGVEDYSLTGTTLTISRSTYFALTYNGSAALNLTAGPGADIFDIDTTSAATTVNAGAGGNCFHISPVTQYLAASILGPLTLNGGGADILDFFDANDPNAETFSFDGVPSSLTLGSTGTTIANFAGMGSIYVMTNGFSTPDDQSGLVIFDPDGGPPCGPGNGSNPNGQVPRATAGAAALPDAQASAPWQSVQSVGHQARAAWKSADQLDLLDEVFSQLG